jgi:HAMP domain-containing protein
MRGRIRTRLLVLVTTATLPLLILAAIFLWARFNEDFAKTRTAAASAAQIAAANIDDPVDELNTLLVAVGKMVSRNPADAEKNDAVLSAVKADLPAYMNNILLFDLTGNNIGISQRPSADRSTLYSGERNYFKAAREGRAVISEPIISRLNSQWIVNLARPVFDDAGAMQAVIVIGMQLAHINEIVDSASLPQGSAILILNENGIVVGRTGHPEMTGRDISQHAVVTHRRERRDKVEDMVWLDGVKRMTATGLARAVPWVVTAGVPSVQLSGALAHEQWALVLTGLAVAAAFLLAWALSSGIIRPIRQLQRDAIVFGSGEFDHRSHVQAKGELGELVHTFNNMADSLQQQSIELKRVNMRLDAAIANIPQGLCMFDADKTLVISNNRFRQIYHLTEKQVEPGTPLAQILQTHADNGEKSDLSVEEHVERMPLLASVVGIRDLHPRRWPCDPDPANDDVERRLGCDPR